MKMTTNNILKHLVEKCMHMLYVALIFFLLLFVQACNDINSDIEPEEPKVDFSLNMKSADPSIINNALLYVFDDSAVPNSNFIRRQLNINRTGDVLSTYMAVGTWNLVLLSCTEDIFANITPPSSITGKISDPMWTTQKTTDGNFLKEVPELRYSQIFGVSISEGVTTPRNATLNRNVAKIQLILEEATGFDEPLADKQNGRAYFELHNVPTTLSWEGRLIPNPNTPDVSDKPIRKYLNFASSGKADTLNYIIPAHTPRDGSDIATNKIKLKGCMILNNQEYFGKTSTELVEIEHTPEPNKIIQVKIRFRGEPNTNLDIKVTVRDWAKVEQNIEFL